MSFIFYLMSNYAWQPDKNTAIAISRYLEILSDHPSCESALLANVVKQLSSRWQLIHELNYETNLFMNNK